MAKTRHTKSGRKLTILTPARAGIVVLLLAGLWIGTSFARQLYVSYRLNAQVQELRHNNDRMAQSNAEYQQQLDALSKVSGAEEQARLHNYVKPDERVFIITPSPSPAATASPKSTSAAKPPAAKPDGGGFWVGLWRAITGQPG